MSRRQRLSGRWCAAAAAVLVALGAAVALMPPGGEPAPAGEPPATAEPPPAEEPRLAGEPPPGPLPRFLDRAAAAGVGERGPVFAAAAADFDRDGWPDLAVSRHGEVRLYRNAEGAFRDVSAAMELRAGDTHGLSWIDVDRDGWLDLLVSIGAVHGLGRGDNHLYRNRSGHRLAARHAPEVLRDPRGRGRCFCALDYDRDGRLDALVVNFSQKGRPSRLARATAGGGWAPGAADGLGELATECLTAVHLARSGPATLLAYGGGADAGRAFRPAPDGRLIDVTAALGIPAGPGIYSVAAGDYDNDGDLDLYLVRGIETPPALERTPSGLRFRLVSNWPAHRPRFRFRCAGEFRADLRLGFRRDRFAVYLGADGGHPPSIPWTVRRRTPVLDGAPPIAQPPPPAPSAWQRLRRALSRQKTPPGSRRDAAPAEPGLYVWRSAQDEYDVMLVRNAYRWRSISGRFSGPDCSFGVLDASEELLRPQPPAPNVLLRNDGGRFVDVTVSARVGDPRSGRDAAFFDADNDGDLDLFVVNAGLAFGQQPDVLYLNRGDGTFDDVTAEAGVAGPPGGRGATVTAFDYDRDGAVDLFVTNGDGPPPGNDGPYHLWRNESGAPGNWVEIDLVGGADNPAAMGAAVLARFGGRRLLLERTSTSARFSTSVLPLHVGIGDAAEVDLEVRWPSGRTSRAVARPAERLVLTEPPAASGERRDG